MSSVFTFPREEYFRRWMEVPEGGSVRFVWSSPELASLADSEFEVCRDPARVVIRGQVPDAGYYLNAPFPAGPVVVEPTQEAYDDIACDIQEGVDPKTIVWRSRGVLSWEVKRASDATAELHWEDLLSLLNIPSPKLKGDPYVWLGTLADKEVR